ncbi:MAG: tetratricopeptide repeat protein [Planctomycetes bacterium]|nr:tetratricopeptide repeat protein [Planctomycetota bacterium]
MQAAIVVAEKILTIERETLGDDAEDYLGTLMQLAEMYIALDNFEHARQAQATVLATQTKLHGADDWRVTDARLALADVKFQEKLSIEDRKSLRDVEHDKLRAYQFFDSVRLAEAIEVLLRVAATEERIWGPNRRQVAATHVMLGGSYLRQRNLAAAKLHLDKALTIQEMCLGLDHPDIATTLTGLSGVALAQNRFADAEPLEQRTLKIR